MIKDAVKGKLDWQGRPRHREARCASPNWKPMMSFTTAAGMVAAVAGKHYPAPHGRREDGGNRRRHGRDEALAARAATFIKLWRNRRWPGRWSVSSSTISTSGRWQERPPSRHKQGHRPCRRAGMPASWGGIAYQSASKGIPAMKDINEKGWHLA